VVAVVSVYETAEPWVWLPPDDLYPPSWDDLAEDEDDG
jgi:hypothetical protein